MFFYSVVQTKIIFFVFRYQILKTWQGIIIEDLNIKK